MKFKQTGHMYYLLAKLYGLRMHLPFYKEKPIFAGFELTNVCNLKCVMCALTYSDKKKGFMDFEFFKSAFNQVYDLGIRNIGFHIQGEPIMHPKIREIVAYVNKEGVEVGLSTNMQLMTEGLARDLMKNGVKYFRLSIEGSNKEDYEKIRVNGKFEVLLKNMEILKNLRDREFNDVNISINSVYMENNQDIIEFYDTFAHLVDEITYSPINNMGGEIRGVKPDNWRRKRLCIIPFERVYITWDGLLTMCCLDSMNKLIMGDAKKDSIKDIWYGEKYKRYRRLHKIAMQRKIPMCGKCYTSTPYQNYLLNIKINKELKEKKQTNYDVSYNNEELMT